MDEPLLPTAAANLRRHLLTNVPVLALEPVAMLTNMSNMANQEWLDLVGLLPVSQQQEFADCEVFVTLSNGRVQVDWPVGFAGFTAPPELDQTQSYHVWMRCRLRMGTAREHARFAAYSAIGLEWQKDGRVLLQPSPRFAQLVF